MRRLCWGSSLLIYVTFPRIGWPLDEISPQSRNICLWYLSLAPVMFQQVLTHDLWVIYFHKMLIPALSVFQRVCERYRGPAHHGLKGTKGAVFVCLLWFTVSCVPVSRQAPSSGSCTPALSYTSGWQAKLLKGWTEAHRLCLAQLTHKIKTQCYRSVSASLWCQGVLLIRGSPEG